jgi:hypothetical protein
LVVDEDVLMLLMHQGRGHRDHNWPITIITSRMPLIVSLAEHLIERWRQKTADLLPRHYNLRIDAFR